MDDLLHTRFQRVEAALNSLVDSISSYNPSPAAALDLVAADDELNKGLDQLAVHQSNHARILALRHTADTLDHQVKESLALLADTRKELLATPVTAVPKTSRDVPLDELLAYAKRISKFTVPPTYRPPLPGEERDAAAASGDDTPDASAGGVKVENGTVSPAGPTASQNGNPPSQPDPQGEQDTQGVGVSALSDEQRGWLQSASKIPFVPWPSEEVIRRGGLAHIQTMLEQGKDPATYDPGAEQKPDAPEGAEDDEQQRKSQEEADARRRQSIAGGMATVQRQEQAPAVFGGLELYDPDEL